LCAACLLNFTVQWGWLKSKVLKLYPPGSHGKRRTMTIPLTDSLLPVAEPQHVRLVDRPSRYHASLTGSVDRASTTCGRRWPVSPTERQPFVVDHVLSFWTGVVDDHSLSFWTGVVDDHVLSFWTGVVDEHLLSLRTSVVDEHVMLVQTSVADEHVLLLRTSVVVDDHALRYHAVVDDVRWRWPTMMNNDDGGWWWPPTLTIAEAYRYCRLSLNTLKLGWTDAYFYLIFFFSEYYKLHNRKQILQPSQH